MRITRNFAISILFFYIIYYLQGILYENGSVLSQMSMLLIILTGIVFTVKCFTFKRISAIILYWSLFLIINIIYFIGTFALGDLPEIGTSVLKGVLACLLPFYVFYYISRKNIVKESIFEIFFYPCLIVTMLQFFINQNVNTDDPAHSVTNLSYVLAHLIPFVFIIKKRILIKAVILFFIVSCVIIGAKRGAIVISVASVLIFCIYLIKTVGRKSILSIMSSFILISVFIYGIYYSFTSNEYVVQRFLDINEGDISGRDVIYEVIFSKWINGDFVNFLFGYGFAGSVKLTGYLLAHNDWLEIASNFGLLGIIIYLLLLKNVFVPCFDKTLSIEYKYMMITIVLSWMLTTIFSTWYNSIDNFTQTILLGYVIGQIDRRRYSNVNDNCAVNVSSSSLLS